MSVARISSGDGVRPTPYLGDSASSPAHARATPNLASRISHAPVCENLPGPDAVVVIFVICSAHCDQGLVRRLHVTGLIRCARLHDGFSPVPVPGSWKRVSAVGSLGSLSPASCHVLPPSVETSTRSMRPRPG